MINDRSNEIDVEIKQLIENKGGNPNSFEGQLISQIIDTGLKLLREGHDIGQLKVISRSMREMRYAYRIFNQYKQGPCISIFGSARTPEHHPDYIAAKNFSTEMSKRGWMCITGAANGIMKACAEGPQKNQSFGLCIKLPFEIPTNTVIEGDPKLITFRFFFTRKLMFMSHSNAMAAFPGGFGTLDELFEMLTLIQTGKANIIPIVLAEGKGGHYWQDWELYIRKHLLYSGFISPEDERLFYIAPDPNAAVEHILKFYTRYHSSRYVKDVLVIRMLSPLNESQLEQLNQRYRRLISHGVIISTAPLDGETDHLELPRIAFHHTKQDFGLLRMLIDEINEF